MKIYTKTGDSGTTSLIGGTRVPKNDLRIECYGTVDELSAWIGLIRDQQVSTKISSNLIEVQENLFTIGSILACDTAQAKLKIPEISENEIEFLESEIDTMSKELSELKSFLLSGGHTIVSYCHIARTVCRRSERLIIQFSSQFDTSQLILKYLNRLSDYLFVLSRKIAKDVGAKETLWNPKS